jgi:hypothetical protein
VAVGISKKLMPIALSRCSFRNVDQSGDVGAERVNVTETSIRRN